MPETVRKNILRDPGASVRKRVVALSARRKVVSFVGRILKCTIHQMFLSSSAENYHGRISHLNNFAKNNSRS